MKIKKFILKNLFFVFFSFSTFAQSFTSIDYYGIVCTEIDSNMAKMTSDLYFTQLSDLQTFTINDLREKEYRDTPPENFLNNSNLAFYVTIQKNANSEKWQTQLHLINKNANINQIEKKEYESFYKILMEPKSTLQQTLHQLLSSANGNNQNSDKDSNNHFFSPASISTDLLAGTWGGEENINKIVIMRSGRGFVIFKNGASMNILIKIQKAESDTKVIITQESRPNASFFPELPRTVALQAAKEAEPIEWTLSLLNDNTLSGTKKTLTLASDNQTSMSKLNVTWHRK